MEVKIKGTEEFVKACTNSTVLQEMIEKNFIAEDIWRPFNPITENPKLCGVIKKTKKGTIVMYDLSKNGK